jgi:UPF0755 protein
MSRYVRGFRERRSRGWVHLIVLGLVLVLAVSFIAWYQSYARNLRPVSTDTTQKVFAVASGTSVQTIANGLADQGLIRKAWAFERYVTDKRLGSKLQAGTYKLSPSQSSQEIAAIMAEGKVAVDLITILPGQRIDQVKDAFIAAKFDQAAVDAAFDPAQYADLPVLANLPSGANLEGFLYPDSYQKDATTNPAVIVRAALVETQTHLSTDITTGFSAQGLTPYQGITLASVVEKEVSHPEDRTQVAQVFLKRLREGKKLESDVTAFYGAIKDGQEQLVSYDSPYNTYKVSGLPVGPISNVSENALRAVAFPASTDWLYFVAGDDGKTYFSHTLAEHEALTRQYCKKLCGN